MKRLWLQFLVAALLLPWPFYLFFGYSDIADLAPGNTEALIMVNDPVDWVDRAANSELALQLENHETGKALKPAFDLWRKSREKDWLFTGLRHFVRRVYIAFPHDRTPNLQQPEIMTFYVDLGFAGRVASDLMNFGVGFLKGQAVTHHGRPVIVQPPMAYAFLDNYFVAGSADNVMASVATMAGVESGVDAAGKRLARARRNAPDADIVFYVLSRTPFRVPSKPTGKIDARTFVNATGIDYAVGGLDIENGRWRAEFEIVAVPGKIVSPYTQRTGDPFATLSLPDSGTVGYAALRINRASELAPVMIGIFDSEGRLTKLRRQLLSLALQSLLDHAGHELAIVFSEEKMLSEPVYVFLVEDPAEMTSMLEKLSKTANEQAAALQAPVGTDGQSVGEKLAEVADSAQLNSLLQQLPAGVREKVAAVADQVTGGADLQRLLTDTQHLTLGTTSLFWRISDNRLVLSQSRTLADRYHRNLESGRPPDEFARAADFVPQDGPLVAWINLVPLLDKSAGDLSHPLAWLSAKRPRLAVGAVETGAGVKFLADLNMDIGLGESRDANAMWILLFWLLGGLVVLGGVVGGLIVVRGVLAIARRG
ncbi:MAG: hypothetical protein P9L99_15795 [Candidatus Lernaella stagnicola]|nr:hypothetical protein [Candidatus Lernaella stagnicola]